MENQTLFLKDIHIGKLLKLKSKELGVTQERTCAFIKCNSSQLKDIYLKKVIDTDLLLRFSKLLEYDFFRLYTQHLIFYSPPQAMFSDAQKTKTKLPQFRKNIYTQEIIEFILSQIEKKEKTKQEIIDQYKIPKTTLYKWISKYRK